MLPSLASVEYLEMIGAFLTLSSRGLRTIFWVGGTNRGGNKKGDWRWLDGSLWKYEDWNTGEPNDNWEKRGAGSGIFTGKAGKWTDLPSQAGGGSQYEVATICQRGTMSCDVPCPMPSLSCYNMLKYYVRYHM